MTDASRVEDVTAGSLTPQQVEYHLEVLRRHFAEQVRPVSEYCQAFRLWRDAISDKIERVKAGAEDIQGVSDEDVRGYREYELGLWEPVLEALNELELPIMKSNLLARLVYAGQHLRSEPCPVHKGRWSGYSDSGFGREHRCECQDGLDLTGWLPVDQTPLWDRIAMFVKSKGWAPASLVVHYPTSDEFDPDPPAIAAAGPVTCRGRTTDEAIRAAAAELHQHGFVG